MATFTRTATISAVSLARSGYAVSNVTPDTPVEWSPTYKQTSIHLSNNNLDADAYSSGMVLSDTALNTASKFYFEYEINPGVGPHRYWSMFLTGKTANDRAIIGEVEFKAGGVDLVTSSNAYSTENSPAGSGTYSVAGITDNSTATFESYATDATAFFFIGMDYGSPVEIDEVTLSASDNSYYTSVVGVANAVEIRYSDDGSTWHTAGSYSGLTWSTSETKTFAVAAPSVSHQIGLACTQSFAAIGGYPGDTTYSLGIFSNGSIGLNDSYTGTFGTVAPGDIVSIAVDLVSEQMWFRVNGGSWWSSAAFPSDPSSGTFGYSISGLASLESIYALASISGVNLRLVTTANDFSYTPPSGFSAPGVAGSGSYSFVRAPSTYAASGLTASGSTIHNLTASISSASSATALAIKFTVYHAVADVWATSTVTMAAPTVIVHATRSATISSASTFMVTNASELTKRRSATIAPGSTVVGIDRALERHRSATFISAATLGGSPHVYRVFARVGAITDSFGNFIAKYGPTGTQYRMTRGRSATMAPGSTVVGIDRSLTRAGAAAITASSSVAPAYTLASARAAAVTSSSSVGATWIKSRTSTADINAVSTTSAVTRGATYTRQATVAPASALVGVYAGDQRRTASVGAVSTVTGTGAIERRCSASITSASSVAASTFITTEYPRSATAASASSLTSAASTLHPRSATMGSTTSVGGATVVFRLLGRQAGMASHSTVTVNAQKITFRTASFAANLSVQPTREVMHPRAVQLHPAATVAATAACRRDRNTRVFGASSCTVAYNIDRYLQASLTGVSSISANETMAYVRSFSVIPASALVVVRKLTRDGLAYAPLDGNVADRITGGRVLASSNGGVVQTRSQRDGRVASGAPNGGKVIGG